MVLHSSNANSEMFEKRRASDDTGRTLLRGDRSSNSTGFLLSSRSTSFNEIAVSEVEWSSNEIACSPCWP